MPVAHVSSLGTYECEVSQSVTMRQKAIYTKLEGSASGVGDADASADSPAPLATRSCITSVVCRSTSQFAWYNSCRNSQQRCDYLSHSKGCGSRLG